MFLVIKTRTNFQSMCQSMLWRKTYWLNTDRWTRKKELYYYEWFQYIHVWLHIHRGKNHFCCYCLQVFRTAGVLKSGIKDCSKYNGKQKIMSKNKRCLKKVNMLNSKIMKTKTVSIYDLCRFSKYYSAWR